LRIGGNGLDWSRLRPIGVLMVCTYYFIWVCRERTRCSQFQTFSRNFTSPYLDNCISARKAPPTQGMEGVLIRCNSLGGRLGRDQETNTADVYYLQRWMFVTLFTFNLRTLGQPISDTSPLKVQGEQTFDLQSSTKGLVNSPLVIELVDFKGRVMGRVRMTSKSDFKQISWVFLSPITCTCLAIAAICTAAKRLLAAC
jgi:hypothetical protein